VELSEVQRSRLSSVYSTNATALKTEHGSGKTLVLWAIGPGPRRCVVRLHRRDHKTFYAIVKLAQAWLDDRKAETARLAVAKAQVILPAETLRLGDIKKFNGTLQANHYFSPRKNIFAADMALARALIEAERRL
jgi:hypothetical protein